MNKVYHHRHQTLKGLLHVTKPAVAGLEIKKILRSAFGDQLEKCSRQM